MWTSTRVDVDTTIHDPPDFGNATIFGGSCCAEHCNFLFTRSNRRYGTSNIRPLFVFCVYYDVMESSHINRYNGRGKSGCARKNIVRSSVWERKLPSANENFSSTNSPLPAEILYIKSELPLFNIFIKNGPLSKLLCCLPQFFKKTSVVPQPPS